MIKLQIIGNLGKDCVVNTVNGKTLSTLPLHTLKSIVIQQGNNQEKTTWVDCAYWTDKTAVRSIYKGKQYLQKALLK
jgi:single-strand DNA-binding protein